MYFTNFFRMSQKNTACFSRPAEWGRHARTILAWPGKASVLAESSDDLRRATNDISAIAEEVAHFEPVTLLVGNERLKDAQRQFKSVKTPHSIIIHPIQGDSLDLWMRDIAPTFVMKHQPDGTRTMCGVDFNFNGWGNRFPTPTTSALARTLLGELLVERVPSSIVAEGGSLEIDGEGTLIATESSLVNKNRNPGKNRQAIEEELIRTLGVKKVIWIPGRPGLDITDCHIDGLARFIRPGTILLSKSHDTDESEWSIIYEEARKILLNSTDARGQRFHIVEILEPDLYRIGLDSRTLKKIDKGKEEPPAMSYVNYLLVNGGVILPQFGDKAADAKAVEVMRGLFGAERVVVPVLIKELPFLGGGIHCATQEIPLACS